MTSSRRSVFRDALQVSPERIAALGDADLNVLMRELLRAQAYRCGAAVKEICVNTEGRAKDDGCDGWSPKPTSADDWLGASDTCWQFKAGSAGEPARLAKEVTKRLPTEALTAGGRFVVVATGSTNGKKGEDDRLEKLRNEAQAAGLPTDAIVVFGSERLANWCNQHPAIAARWASRPDGLWSLEDWLRSDEHQVQWQSTPAVQQEIEARRRDLDVAAGSVHHLHIQGPPGVGKTRFALELCRDADWRGAVIYVRQASDVRLTELIDGATADMGVRLVVVADEVQADQLRPFRDSVGRGQGRVRMITIGHSKTPDPTRIPALAVAPLGRQPMTEVIKGWYPAMPPEHVDFIVRFADGYVRLARLAADAVVRDPSMNVRGLLDLENIRAFLDEMLGEGDRRPLYVVAVLSSVGWTDDRQLEGESVARHLGLDWNSVRATVDDFHRRLGIAPRGGRYRYISPTPLGIHLAVEAWTTYPDLLKTLPTALPTEEARDAYYERLQAIASNPQARQFARDELSFVFRVDDFVDARVARRWSALSAADPAQAARNIRDALAAVDPEERKRIAERARRETVWTLVRLAWKPSAFHHAVTALALLAEAENETWANNASAEFVARFQVFLGGTAVAYLDRLSVLDELLATGRPALARLVVKALTQVGNRHAFRMGSEPASDELPEPEWRPTTGHEHLACAEEAIGRLSSIARTGVPDLQDALVEAARDLSMLLRDAPVRALVANFFEAVRDAYPDTREALRRAIADVAHREQKYWKELPLEDVGEIEVLHGRFEDASLGARLRQYVGQASWERDEQVDLTPLATELLAGRDLLAAEWPWLTSGEAADGWRLGEALATVDPSGSLDHVLPDLGGRGRDLRVLCGYVHKRRGSLGTVWFDGWMTAQLERDATDMPLLFEVTWRCGATVNTAQQVAVALRQQDVEPHIVGQLGFRRWGEELPADVMEEVLRAMTDRGHRETAIAILVHRLEIKPEEANEWADLALELVRSAELVRSGHMASYYWKKVAGRLVSQHARKIAAAILREQADRESGTWFAEHSEAGAILYECVERAPAGVWEELKPYLSLPAAAYMFSIGFPRGVLERMPATEVADWISENPDERALMLAHLVSKNLSNDGTLASRLIGSYGDNERVASAFFSEYVSGSWTGPASAHWTQLAVGLAEVARRTSLPKLRRWADDGARSLRQMAERDQQREEEEDLRRR